MKKYCIKKLKNSDGSKVIGDEVFHGDRATPPLEKEQFAWHYSKSEAEIIKKELMKDGSKWGIKPALKSNT